MQLFGGSVAKPADCLAIYSPYKARYPQDDILDNRQKYFRVFKSDSVAESKVYHEKDEY